jgi:hypothetical protein
LEAETKELTESAKIATDEQKPEIEKSLQSAAAKQKSAEAAVKVAEKQVKSATAKAKPKDIVDIVVSTPITIRVQPAKEAEKK